MYFVLQNACLLLIFFLGLDHQTTLAQNRIIGGYQTNIERFPYMLRLQVGRRTGNIVSVCGASIIGREWGLTAAHCFDNSQTDYNKIFVTAGTTDIRNLSRTARVHKVIRVIRHEYYRGVGANQAITADIAVIKVSQPFSFNYAIQPVKLPSRWRYVRTSTATVSGWGRTWPGWSASNILRAVKVPKVNTASCAAQYRRAGIRLKLGEICYGYNKAWITRDKCQGDSGGPLVNSQRIELGLVSWGVECGTRRLPGVYTDVRYFRNWIKWKTGI